MESKTAERDPNDEGEGRGSIEGDRPRPIERDREGEDGLGDKETGDRQGDRGGDDDKGDDDNACTKEGEGDVSGRVFK